MSSFLLELRSEEIPARMQAGARATLEKLFRDGLASAGVSVGALQVFSTPRRLALIAQDLPLATKAVSEELKGPRSNAPAQALEGFLRKTGLTQDQLTERDGVYYAVNEKPGRATTEVLAEVIPAIVRGFAWPKSQRWGAASLSTESLRWVRPLQGIVALFDGAVVACEVGGIVSGRMTMGHRFHSSGAVEVASAETYAAQLREAFVLVDQSEREGIIRSKAAEVAAAAGLVLVEDEGLVVENAGLTEWPQPLLGRFDEEFLEVPPETIQLTARTNQKYFICRDAAGKLANAFVCTANIVATDGGTAIVAGNRKVLAARLSDARFFWQQDRKKLLSTHAEGLARITFHEKLGTVADKVERVAKLARWLVEEGIVTASPTDPQATPAHPELVEGSGAAQSASTSSARAVADLADMAEQAARLCKADLTTEMVGEFPELQGLMGGYYARAEGLPDAVAEAIRDHYKPVGQGDDVPTAPVTVAVALADKLDTLAGFFFEQEKPTGSRDPFALRRAALGVVQTIIANNLRIGLKTIFETSINAVGYRAVKLEFSRLGASAESAIAMMVGAEQAARIMDAELAASFDAERYPFVLQNFQKNMAAEGDLLAFFADRLKVQQKEAGVRHDLIDAVFALGGEDDLVRLLARVHALQAFVATEDGKNLLAGYKRAANILKKEGYTAPLPLAGGAGGGAVYTQRLPEEVPTPNPSRKREGDYATEPAEAALIAALDIAAPSAATAVAAEDFAGAMAALSALRAPIDAFFESVTVNDADANKRNSRLDLLAKFRDAVQHVADFSRIEG